MFQVQAPVVIVPSTEARSAFSCVLSHWRRGWRSPAAADGFIEIELGIGDLRQAGRCG
jgi:hypothetical protein